MSENMNKYYVDDGLTDKDRYLTTWGYVLGTDEAESAWKEKCAFLSRRAPMVMGDIDPYISQIDGSIIESRSKHRAHLKQHNCIEIGNETKELYRHKKPLESPSGLREHLIKAVNDSQEKQKRRY